MAASALRMRSIHAEIQRAKADIERTRSARVANNAIEDHRAGWHDHPYDHQRDCYACLAWCRRDQRRKELEP